LLAATVFCTALLPGILCSAADTGPQVSLEIAKAAPRAVEPLTQRSIIRDYKLSWTGLSRAFEAASIGPLNGLFEGQAYDSLRNAVADQQKNGLKSICTNQTHRLEAVFYAPEGDVIELHDTAEYDLQITDGDKSIHNKHEVVRYVVLMTPGADRWVIRQMQAVPQF
jgi:hypothetical protein